MSEIFKWLQFFADGASGGDGGDGAAAGSGVTAADAGQDDNDARMMDQLRIPADKAERFKKAQKRLGKKDPSTPLRSAQDDSGGKENANGSTDVSSANNGVANDSEWDAFFSKQENKDRLQQMMAERGKSATEAKQAAAAQMEKLNPMLKLLGEKYGVKPGEDGSYDLDAISNAVTGDDSYYEEKALEMGVSVDVARKLEQADEMERQQQAQREKMQRDAMLKEHFNNVIQQAQQFAATMPGFDLNREMQNLEFVRRTAPGQMSVEDAYYSLHHKEIMQQQASAIAKQARQAASSSIAAGSMRPKENGSAATATVSAVPNLKAMSTKDRRAYIMQKYPPTR